uniref:Uncharacterized protein n=1 Tax=Knipowitschia caucasica TaxID=637954 RepID=A0AAV2KB63_KNICA
MYSLFAQMDYCVPQLPWGRKPGANCWCFVDSAAGFRAVATATDGSKCLAMEYGGEQSLNDMIERRREDGLKAFPAANIEKVALHVARGSEGDWTVVVSRFDRTGSGSEV